VVDETEFSVTAPKTIDGLRVAVAGLSPDMPVERSSDLDLATASVNELRALKRLPYPVEVIIPYRIRHDSKVRLRRLKLEE
jgi:hypothetical protein